MARIYQQSLFSWKDVDDLGDLERLQLVIDNIPDEKLIALLYALRGRGRNDNPIEAMWNSILAGIVFQHDCIESLRRELLRNAQLRELCGFDPLKGSQAVPSKSAYGRFLKKLLSNKDLVDEMFNSLVQELFNVLPGFGSNLAFDSKAIESHANKTGSQAGDHRGEQGADWGRKSYSGIREDGSTWEKVKSWFGFKLHLVVDADYELPVAMSVTKASTADIAELPNMLQTLSSEHPLLLDRCEHGIGDRGYDSTGVLTSLWEKYGIKPIIDIRNMWKDNDSTRTLPSGRYTNLTYNYKGTVFCHCPQTGEVRPMVYGGFDRKRGALKFVCPMVAKGIECKGACQCPLKGGVRIKLGEDHRVFTPVSRSSYKWKRLYNKRTSVERVNSRIGTSFGFGKHYIRGKAKMELRCSLALCVMLSMALGRIKQGQQEKMRSLVKAA